MTYVFGNYCADVQPWLRPGDVVIDRTWRSDPRFLSTRGNSQPDYGGYYD